MNFRGWSGKKSLVGVALVSAPFLAALRHAADFNAPQPAAGKQ